MSSIQSNHRLATLGRDHYLITPQNGVLQLHGFKSAFAKELSDKLMDPERGAFIAQKFEEIILSKALLSYNADTLHEWKEALKYYASLLGNDSDYMEKTFKEKAHPLVQTFIQNSPEVAKAFFDAIAEREIALNASMGNKSKEVVILTSSSGGGHITTANAVKEMVEKKGFKAVILNQDELDKENDPLLKAGVTYKGEPITMAEVYNRVFQQDNNLEEANKLWGLGNEIAAFVPSRQMENVAKRIRAINPAMILSVATHHQEHASLANMTGIKLNYVHTDFDFNNALLPIVDKVDAQRINFWVNSDDDQILEGKKLGSYEVPLKPLKERNIIKVCGYPVRPSFVREEDPVKISEIKSKKGIDPNRKVALLSMGRQGIKEHILKYLNLLLKEKDKLTSPLELVVIAGKNEELKKELDEFIKSHDSELKDRLHIKVEGFVDEKDMADYYKIASVINSKPGGAASAECAEMGLPMLAVDPHPWEVPNLKYLERHGLAEALRSEDSYVEQLNSLIEKKEKGISFKAMPWKEALSSLIDQDLPKAFVKAKQVAKVKSPNQSQMVAFQALMQLITKMQQEIYTTLYSAPEKLFNMHPTLFLKA